MMRPTKQKLITYLILAGLCGLTLSFAMPRVQAAPGSAISNLPSPDGTTHAIKVIGNKLYVGGEFKYIGTPIGANAIADTSTGNLSASTFPAMVSSIETSVPDGSGGWYIGGSFALVGGQARLALAHIQSNGMLDTAFPQITAPSSASVATLVLSGSTLYVGGNFSSVNGTGRNNIAAIDVVGKIVTSFNPDSDGGVQSLAISGTTLYVGGFFSDIGGQTRNFLAALSTITGNATSFEPILDDSVFSLLISGATLYIGGRFSFVNGELRIRVASIDTGTELITAFDPALDDNNSIVRTMQISGATLYIGGTFTQVGADTRTGVAAINTLTSSATAFDADIDIAPGDDDGASISSILLSGGTLYIGGIFATASGQTRANMTPVNATTGAVLAWTNNLAFGGGVFSLSLSGANLLVGSGTVLNNAVARHNFGVINLNDYSIDSLDIDFDATVKSFESDGTTLFVSGDFTTVEGQSRNFLAAIDIAGQSVTSWNPNPDAGVNCLLLSNGTLYVGGEFTSISGLPRQRIAAFNVATGNATTWHPDSSGAVNSIALYGSLLYIGGGFSSVGGQNRNFLGSVDINTANATSFDPDPDSTVEVMTILDNTLYVGGDFNTIAGSTRNNVAAFDLTDETLTAWNPNSTRVPQALLAKDGMVFISAGSNLVLGGDARFGLAGVDSQTGVLTGWEPEATVNYQQGSGSGLTSLDSTVYYAGGFSGTFDDMIPTFILGFTFPLVQFTSATNTVAEDDGTINIPIVLDTMADTDVTVDYSVVGGTATGGGVDYTLADGSFTISSGSTSANIPITIIDGDSFESSETVIIELSNPQNAFFDTNSTHTLTITDDEPAPSTGSRASSPIRIPPLAIRSNPSFQNLRLIRQGDTLFAIFNNQRFGITRPEILFSYGLEFEDAKDASAYDLNLPYNDNLNPGDGSLIKELASPTVYLISEGRRLPFVSGEIFTNFGYSFPQIIEVTGPELLSMPTGDPISNPAQAHLPGTYINADGTIFLISNDHAKRGVPDLSVWNSLNNDFDFSHVVAGNLFDTALPQGPLLTARLLQ